MRFEVGDVVYWCRRKDHATKSVRAALFVGWSYMDDSFSGHLTINRGVIDRVSSSGGYRIHDITEITFRYKYPERLTDEYIREMEFNIDDYELIGGEGLPDPTIKHKGIPVEVYNETPIPDGDDLMAAVRDFCDGV